MALSTNLALRPFRNERLPWLLTGLFFAAAIGATVLHGRLVSRLLSGDEANTVRMVRENEARITELEDHISKEPPLRIESAEAARLRAFKELVDRRVFPWRRLLSELEEVLGDDVRLIRISPAAAAFSSASLKSLAETEEGIEFNMDVVFDPATAIAEMAPGKPEETP